jgi:2-polyprenyl-6-methoxyphenol hydroxylase-like FAD-dependent oxidoreductase
MTPTEFEDSVRRVPGADLPLGDVTRRSRYGFHARQAARYRDGRILLADDAARPHGTGRIASTSTPPTPITGQPTPC